MFKFSIRIKHPELDFKDRLFLTDNAIFKIYHRKGAPRFSPKGETLDGNYSSSYLLVNFSVDSENFDEHIKNIETFLYLNLDVLKTLTETGGAITFSFFIQPRKKYSEAVLPSSLLDKLHLVKAEILIGY